MGVSVNILFFNRNGAHFIVVYMLAISLRVGTDPNLLVRQQTFEFTLSFVAAPVFILLNEFWAFQLSNGLLQNRVVPLEGLRLLCPRLNFLQLVGDRSEVLLFFQLVLFDLGGQV